MMLKQRNLINLGTNNSPNTLGHVSKYRLNNGNLYNVFFIEARYFGYEEICCKTGKIIKEDRSLGEYDYKIDLFFKDRDRDLGWDSTLKDW